MAIEALVSDGASGPGLGGEVLRVTPRYGHDRHDAPPGARLMQLRMFYIPDEPAEPEP